MAKSGSQGSGQAAGVAGWVFLSAACLGAALYARYGFIQSTAIGLGCQGGSPPVHCGLREALIAFNLNDGWGWAALGGGALALVTGWRGAIALGVGAGFAGLVLYNAGPAGAGLLLALLRLVRR